MTVSYSPTGRLWLYINLIHTYLLEALVHLSRIVIFFGYPWESMGIYCNTEIGHIWHRKLNTDTLCVECADRELLPSFHEVSVYPKKELPFFILFTAGLCSFTALLALLTHQYPDSMGVSRPTYLPNNFVSSYMMEDFHTLLLSFMLLYCNGFQNKLTFFTNVRYYISNLPSRLARITRETYTFPRFQLLQSIAITPCHTPSQYNNNLNLRFHGLSRIS